VRRTATVLLALGVAVLSACGGSDGAATTAPSPTGATSTTVAAPTTAATLSPAELGDQIGDLYVAAIDDVAALLADRPDPAVAATDLADLKEQYIEQMVAFGYQREALDTAGRAVVDARITAALNGVPSATYDAYQAAYAYYGEDLDVANLIAAFNIIGQYANFDLLRQQEPEEAARLGLD
jgi:hypothetical protein